MARVVFNVPRYPHVTPLLTDLHWLPVITRIKFKTLVLAYQAVKGSAPAYIQKLIRPYAPARPLRSATSGRLAPDSPHPPPVTPALLVHDCCLFWPHDGGMTFLWMSEQRRPPSKSRLFFLTLKKQKISHCPLVWTLHAQLVMFVLIKIIIACPRFYTVTFFAAGANVLF